MRDARLPSDVRLRPARPDRSARARPMMGWTDRGWWVHPGCVILADGTVLRPRAEVQAAAAEHGVTAEQAPGRKVGRSLPSTNLGDVELQTDERDLDR